MIKDHSSTVALCRNLWKDFSDLCTLEGNGWGEKVIENDYPPFHNQGSWVTKYIVVTESEVWIRTEDIPALHLKQNAVGTVELCKELLSYPWKPKLAQGIRCWMLIGCCWAWFQKYQKRSRAQAGKSLSISPVATVEKLKNKKGREH